MIRLLQICIVLFWLGTTGWLAWTIWKPGGTGFVEMDPQEALDTFFEWNESTTMTIMENGRRIGQVNVSGVAGEDRRKNRGFLKTFSMAGSLDNTDQPGSVGLFWRALHDFDNNQPMNLLAGELSLRIPARQLTAHVEVEGDPAVLKARALLGEVKLFEYDGDPEKLPEVPGTLTEGLGGSLLGDFTNPESLQPEIKASRGDREFGTSREIPVFRLEISPGPDMPGLVVFLSTAGEPLKVETEFGVELISEVLVPLEVYR
ncbi:MAG: hypothetical protein HKN23_14640 [Verrucomicrobiales bacterium]|nr:hypothetical protein [Verrucomicrobiales bacterium]